MADVKPDGQYGYVQQPIAVAPVPQGAPAAVASAPKQQYVQQTPTWVVVIRGFQIFLSLIILGIAAWLMHGNVLDENAFALVCSIFTWIVVAYTLITEKVTSARGAYNIWAVMSLDLFIAILWLASMGANAALRQAFNSKITVNGCYDTGSTFNAHYCWRRLAKRGREGAIASDLALNMIALISGVSAIIMILFIVTLVFHGHTFRLWHAANKTPSNVEAGAQPQPYAQQPAAPVQQFQAPAAAPAYSAPQSYPQQAQTAFVPSPVGTPAPQQPFQAPQQQQYGYPNQPPQQQYGQPQQAYSPQPTPAPGQPYYPPQQ
ncbi:hypothetical protein QBC38DRAFT_531389 [Podospora fimiseda]|uniref:MARVEL domain-containing protein n=1 Tax=Podospora fimiseda TaxID=252190 RepID=A0AAN7BKU0_9PEZI|nr:hypothetical protein QBC38DRAFT_531389 [Podospora fimiseda]